MTQYVVDASVSNTIQFVYALDRVWNQNKFWVLADTFAD
jgi:hypothetical protein